MRALPLLLLVSACVAARPLPQAQASAAAPDDSAASLSAMWVGHATVLLRFGHRTVLTDPNLGGALLGVIPRLTPAALKCSQLPRIDVALLSHMHFDHFDAPTVRHLRGAAVFFPAGGEPYADEIDQHHKKALQPWESVQVDGLTVTAVPARHQGGRFGVDFLWNHSFSGYVIQGAGHTVYFAGDTGYDPSMFKEIGRRFPNIEIAFIPIAPNRSEGENGKDRWGHVGPRGALDIFADLGAKYMVPIHYEAFFSTGQRFGEPRRALEAEVAHRGLQDRVFALHTGDRLALESLQPLVIRAGPSSEIRGHHTNLRPSAPTTTASR